jgi:hypothetical protein
MSEPKFDNVSGIADPVREAKRYKEQRKFFSVGWLRGERAGQFEVTELLRKWRHPKLANRLLSILRINMKGERTL